ncbi:hypothetical protein DCE79_12755 [Lysinibacillus sp. 2017]|uniref:hypothetical protein n=1 Tax=unclassified Lysinibacillus TaxID=2636778 RepID=UPI000D5279DD|nr:MULTISPECIES: hypothetical protein [unclassified Lysinibacillus]AWE08211.1 hypothetical protein DCE79_12755 [Lysinibacillus sp. 2017]TGN36286.1 hypothetical protein E4L99_05190 [Lysinibacillus sp. S2017]
MVHHNEGEIKAVIQALLAIFISYTLLRFLSVFAITFNGFTAFGVIIGAAILYFSLRKNKEFDTFVGLTCLLAVPFSILFGLSA